MNFTANIGYEFIDFKDKTVKCRHGAGGFPCRFRESCNSPSCVGSVYNSVSIVSFSATRLDYWKFFCLQDLSE